MCLKFLKKFLQRKRVSLNPGLSPYTQTMLINTVAHYCWTGWCWAVRMSSLVDHLDSQAPEAHSRAMQEVRCLNLIDSGPLLWEGLFQDPHYWLGSVAVLQSRLLPPPAQSQNPDYAPGTPVCLWSLLMENRTGRKHLNKWTLRICYNVKFSSPKIPHLVLHLSCLPRFLHVLQCDLLHHHLYPSPPHQYCFPEQEHHKFTYALIECQCCFSMDLILEMNVKRNVSIICKLRNKHKSSPRKSTED